MSAAAAAIKARAAAAGRIAPRMPATHRRTASSLRTCAGTAEFARIRAVVRDALAQASARGADAPDGGAAAFYDGVPYMDILRSLYGEDGEDPGGGGVHASFFRAPADAAGRAREGAPALARVPVVCRSYEESFMREVVGADEQACCAGESCECMFIDPAQPFVGVRFQLLNPGGDPDIDAVNQRLFLCVLCVRALTQRLFYNLLHGVSSANGVVQIYGNIIGRAGEYAREVALVCPANGPVHCMPLPVVSHQRNRYQAFLRGGRVHLRQLRVGLQDFC